jgi:hypothetical protein
MKSIFYILIIFLIVLSIILLSIYLRPVEMIRYSGRYFFFRDDIRAAKGIEVHPDEKTIHDLFWNPDVKNITILFNPNVTESGYYYLETFELTYKLHSMYVLNGMKKSFEAVDVNTYDNITSSTDVLKIVLIHPQLADKTLVERQNNIIFIHAKNYRDFDLATIKTILVAMGID